jgi:hypothetical protein
VVGPGLERHRCARRAAAARLGHHCAAVEPGRPAAARRLVGWHHRCRIGARWV